jgi:hypothetical protein
MTEREQDQDSFDATYQSDSYESDLGQSIAFDSQGQDLKVENRKPGKTIEEFAREYADRMGWK